MEFGVPLETFMTVVTFYNGARKLSKRRAMALAKRIRSAEV